MKRTVTALSLGALTAAACLFAQAQRELPTPARDARGQFASLGKRLLDMAKDFPEDKYGYRPTPEVRSFGEVIVHVTSGNAFGARQAKAEQVNWNDWTELDAKAYKSKAEIVTALERSIADASAAMKAAPDNRFAKTPYPWSSVIEHAAEHYGQLVVYYRANHLVPPASRK
jgi:hypothetical protein